MNAVVFEHVKAAELPEAWRSKLAHALMLASRCASRTKPRTTPPLNPAPTPPSASGATARIWTMSRRICASYAPGAIVGLARATSADVRPGRYGCLDLAPARLPPQATQCLDRLAQLNLSAMSYLELLQGMRHKEELAAPVQRAAAHPGDYPTRDRVDEHPDAEPRMASR
jgi:hypothetical protein